MTDNLSSLSRVDVVLREFKEGDAAAFRRLNEEWILRYFRLEEKDETTFADPRSAILDRGGRILFATIPDDNGNEEHAGCCALLAMGDGGYELGKMAVSPRRQGLGIGGRLLRAAVELARQMGATAGLSRDQPRSDARDPALRVGRVSASRSGNHSSVSLLAVRYGHGTDPGRG